MHNERDFGYAELDQGKYNNRDLRDINGFGFVLSSISRFVMFMFMSATRRFLNRFLFCFLFHCLLCLLQSVFSFFLSLLTVHVNESLQWLFTSHSNYSALQRPDAPQGRISPVSFTGSPISCDSTCPPNFFPTSVEII